VFRKKPSTGGVVDAVKEAVMDGHVDPGNLLAHVGPENGTFREADDRHALGAKTHHPVPGRGAVDEMKLGVLYAELGLKKPLGQGQARKVEGGEVFVALNQPCGALKEGVGFEEQGEGGV